MNGNKGALRGILVGVYVLLIALLMLSNCRGCDRQEAMQEVVEDPAAEERAEQVGNDGEIKVTALWDFRSMSIACNRARRYRTLVPQYETSPYRWRTRC